MSLTPSDSQVRLKIKLFTVAFHPQSKLLVGFIKSKKLSENEIPLMMFRVNLLQFESYKQLKFKMRFASSFNSISNDGLVAGLNTINTQPKI